MFGLIRNRTPYDRNEDYKIKEQLLLSNFIDKYFFWILSEFFPKIKRLNKQCLDLSYFLKNMHGVLPIAAPITEPAIGYSVRYQGELTLLAEIEQIINITKHWSLLGFGGIGTNFGNPRKFKS